MSWSRADLEEMADQASKQYRVDRRLLMAVIAQESGWEPHSWNPEPHYRWLWDVAKNQPFRKLTPEELASEKPPADFRSLAGDRDQEWWAQQASWGLMQVMGAVARECGFKGPYIPEILSPFENLRYGCIHLRRKLEQADGNVTRALMLWNGGGNAAYPALVLAKMA